MVYSQIWLIVFPDDRHFDYIIKVEIQKKKTKKTKCLHCPDLHNGI
jgi:hypothetical protein